jgi:hypothetical protein
MQEPEKGAKKRNNQAGEIWQQEKMLTPVH